MANDSFRQCTRCVMDTTDPNITFNEAGHCNHCVEWFARYQELDIGNREKQLRAIAEEIKAQTKNQKYNCIIGVSGGVDSTYCAYYLKKILGLNPLAVHMDNGWNSELAVSNIQNVLEVLDIDLYTRVLDWDEFKDLQLSFLKASTPDSEIPTDHAIYAVIYEVASKYNIKNIFTGRNYATEGISATAWSTGHHDWKYIKSVHKKFGNTKLKDFPRRNLWKFFYQKRLSGFREINMLYFIDYNKLETMELLEKELNWRPYGGKHYESIYTRFFQGYILPQKFGFDKRKLHLSAQICSGQIDREEAVVILEEDPYPSQEMLKEDMEYVTKKLEITKEEFDEIMNKEKKEFWDYPNYRNSWYLSTLMFLTKWIRK